MRTKKLFIFCFLIVISYVLKSQSITYNFHENITFADYLIANNLTDDGLVLLKNMKSQYDFSSSQKDTIHYYLATIYYHLGQFDSASYYYDKVNSNNAYAMKSKFFQVNSCLKMDSISLAAENLLKINTTDTLTNELLQFQLSGVALLQRNVASFDSYSKNYTFSNTNLLNEEKNLLDYSNKIKCFKNKSPFVAGTLSALIPGLGKVYAGKPKQGITSFLPIAILGLQTYEAYNKAGVKSARFIIFGSLFSVFYIGNIWGSALSVHIVNQEINNEINRQILFNLDIPLQRILR